ncbi:MAG: hypothetical protein JWP81_126 [Ferruginibacter sp.]|nr:hypothetical protein [Ferruginibacter sp.]
MTLSHTMRQQADFHSKPLKPTLRLSIGSYQELHFVSCLSAGFNHLPLHKLSGYEANFFL